MTIATEILTTLPPIGVRGRSRAARFIWATALAAALFFSIAVPAQDDKAIPPQEAGVAVGPEYDTTHVYVAPADMDAFVTSFVATFGGKASKRIAGNVLPVASSTEFQYVLTPIGALSVFAYQTPVPYPFGLERTGYLVTDMDKAMQATRDSGGEVIVEPFKDPIGLDAVIQWPGGVKMQLYWHFTASLNPALETVPENRVYVSRDQADNFVSCFLRFSHGKVVADDKHANAGEIGRAGATYRRIRITSKFGNMQVLVTDGHLPYPFGIETTGYEVKDLAATLQRARTAGVKILVGPYAAPDRETAMVQFPGGYVAEIHSVLVR